jgi:hypothetical protein
MDKGNSPVHGFNAGGGGIRNRICFGSDFLPDKFTLPPIIFLVKYLCKKCGLQAIISFFFILSPVYAVNQVIYTGGDGKSTHYMQGIVTAFDIVYYAEIIKEQGTVEGLVPFCVGTERHIQTLA